MCRRVDGKGGKRRKRSFHDGELTIFMRRTRAGIRVGVPGWYSVRPEVFVHRSLVDEVSPRII